MAEDRHHQTEVDRWPIAAGVADVYSCHCGDEAKCHGYGEEVDAGEERSGTEDDLEVEWQVVEVCDEDEAVDIGEAKGSEVGCGLEQTQRSDGVFGDFPFNQRVDDDCHDPEHDQTHHDC